LFNGLNIVQNMGKVKISEETSMAPQDNLHMKSKLTNSEQITIKVVNRTLNFRANNTQAQNPKGCWKH
jgi:hypothetical protein